MPAAEAFRPVRTKALDKAIQYAPGDLTEMKEITFSSEMTLQRMCKVELTSGFRKDLFPHSFKDMYEATIGLLNGKEEVESFNRYLIGAATELTSNRMFLSFTQPEGEESNNSVKRLTEHTNQLEAYQFSAAYLLLRKLTTNGSKSHLEIKKEVLEDLWGKITGHTIQGVSEMIVGRFTDKPATARTLEMLVESALTRKEEVNNFIEDDVDVARIDFKTNGGSAIRFMTDIFNRVRAFCQKKGVETPLLNLTLG